MIFYLVSLTALYFLLRAEAETQDPARLGQVFARCAMLGLVSLALPIYILLINPDLIRFVSATDVLAAVMIAGSLVLGGSYVTLFLQVRRRRCALGLGHFHPVRAIAVIAALLNLGVVAWATTLPSSFSAPIGMGVIVANVTLAVFVEIRWRRAPDSDRFHIVQTVAVINILLGLITVSWTISLSSPKTVLVGLIIAAANSALIVILRRRPKRPSLGPDVLSRWQLLVSQSISAGLGIVVAMIVPLMANLSAAVSMAMIPARWRAPNNILIELVRDAYLAQARVFLISFVAAVALVGLQMLVISGIMAITKRQA